MCIRWGTKNNKECTTPLLRLFFYSLSYGVNIIKFSSHFILFSPKVINKSSLGHYSIELKHESLPQQDISNLDSCVLYGTPVHICHVKNGLRAELRNCHCSYDHSDSTWIYWRQCAVRSYCTWRLRWLMWYRVVKRKWSGHPQHDRTMTGDLTEI